MRLNQKVRYGVGCLHELSKHPGEYLDADQIAKHQTIPSAYAHKVLQHLAHAGFVFAHKGQGYKLARPLSDITALEIIELLSSDIDPEASNPDIGELLENKIDEALNGFTLDELINK